MVVHANFIIKPLIASLSSPLTSKHSLFLSLTRALHTAASTPAAANHRLNTATATASSNYFHSNSKMNTEKFMFGPYKINEKEVFYSTDLSFAMVNLRPVVPDVLVCPKREVKRFVDLTAEETSDIWVAAQKIGSHLESYHKASSLTFTIQDGPQAGQTVSHVHIHILPRKVGDFENNDEIYDAIDGKEKELKEKLDLDKERKDRNIEEMAAEANEYRKLLS